MHFFLSYYFTETGQLECTFLGGEHKILNDPLTRLPYTYLFTVSLWTGFARNENIYSLYPHIKPAHNESLASMVLKFIYSDEEWRFMYKINQGHLTAFCMVFVWLGGPPSPVRIMTQVPWFMYQNQLGPSGSICYPNFAPCFVALYLNVKLYIVKEL